MQLGEPSLDGLHTLARRLDHDLTLDVPLDGALPPIERRHGREDVHAGGETFVDQGARDRFAPIAHGNGRQDEYDVKLFSIPFHSCTSLEITVPLTLRDCPASATFTTNNWQQEAVGSRSVDPPGGPVPRGNGHRRQRPRR
jgi:hypothetical protein